MPSLGLEERGNYQIFQERIAKYCLYIGHPGQSLSNKANPQTGDAELASGLKSANSGFSQQNTQKTQGAWLPSKTGVFMLLVLCHNGNLAAPSQCQGVAPQNRGFYAPGTTT